MTEPSWIELEGVVNARDVGGLIGLAGRPVRAHKLLRSANLQQLTETDVRQLVDEVGVRRIVDLRTHVELEHEGPSRMHSEAGVVIRHLSLHPDKSNRFRVDETDTEVGTGTDATETNATATEDSARPNALAPWAAEQAADGHSDMVTSYLRYLDNRPDSLVAALRAIAEPDGATLVHCAAGKDRTGVVIAMALEMVGVDRAAIAADYALTQTRIDDIIASLALSPLYANDIASSSGIKMATAETMIEVLDAIDAEHGGFEKWLAANGWTDADTAQLRATLLG